SALTRLGFGLQLLGDGHAQLTELRPEGAARNAQQVAGLDLVAPDVAERRLQDDSIHFEADLAVDIRLSRLQKALDPLTEIINAGDWRRLRLRLHAGRVVDGWRE